jgi:hypothetical protein
MGERSNSRVAGWPNSSPPGGPGPSTEGHDTPDDSTSGSESSTTDPATPATSNSEAGEEEEQDDPGERKSSAPSTPLCLFQSHIPQAHQNHSRVPDPPARYQIISTAKAHTRT